MAAAESIHLTTAPTTPESTGVDPDLIAYLDLRFGDIDRRLGEIDRRFDVVDRRFGDVDRRFGDIDRQFGDINNQFGDINNQFGDINTRLGGFDNQLGDINSRLGGIDHQFEELRRHFDVVVESLMSKIELVGEGVRTVDQKLDRFAGETHGEFERIDRRFLHLTASLSPRRRP